MDYTYSKVRNLVWQNKAKTKLQMEVDWDHLDDEEWHPCSTIDLNGVEGEEHLADLWNRAMDGDFGKIKDYKRPRDLTVSETMDLAEIRSLRNRLLTQSDYAISPDKWEDMTPEKKKEWKDYRQELRDVPQNWTMVCFVR